MNGRTCQLCGKALSRFSVGSGGDFCSREHRNQFRLRLGMDRLMEANKVASLMRRRENAKSIPAAQLAQDGNIGPRLAPVLPMPLHRPAVPVTRPTRPALANTGIASHAGRPKIRLQSAAGIQGEARSIERRSFSSRTKQLLLPPRDTKFPTQIKPAGVVLPRLDTAKLAQLRREVTQLRLTLRRTWIGGNGIQVRPLHAPAQHCQEPQPARRLTNSADRGRDLRISGGVGFRLNRPSLRKIEFEALKTNLPASSTSPQNLTICSQPVNGSSMEAGIVRFTIRTPFGPAIREWKQDAAFHWPDRLLTGSHAARALAADTRSCDLKWMAPPPAAPKFRYTNGVARLRATLPEFPKFPIEPRDTVADTRPSLVSFQPQELPFQCPSELHGTLLSAMHFGSAPLRKVEPPAATLEEHFDSGLQNWVGGTEDWKVDVAGVRPGSLALYKPSLDLPNYVLEFLTRFEAHGMTWVFRAANYQDYYQVTVALAQGGGYELRRQTVAGGVADDAVTRRVPPPSSGATGKTAVTVRTRVAGNEFTVSIDGQVIDTWTDARLTGGGIGFVGTPEERARLYWVKVTPIGQHSKEYSKR